MVTNPVSKPKLVTVALVIASVTVLSSTAFFLAAIPAGELSVLVWLALLSTAILVAAIWVFRIRRRHAWLVDAEEKWNHIDAEKRKQRTTTEITVLSVDVLEPTGSWITINWNRFGHVQRAWIEALAEPIWPGSVILISPDPAQVKPGAPWPDAYVIRASDFIAWAPSINLRDRR